MAEPAPRPTPGAASLLARRFAASPQARVLVAALLAALLTALVWFALPALEAFWRNALGAALARLPAYDLAVVASPYPLPAPLAGLALNTALETPDLALLGAHVGAALAVLLLAGLLPAPLRTGLRLLACGHALGALGSLSFPEGSPYSVQEHTAALSLFAECLLLALPTLLALSHWIIERRLARRLAAMALIALWLVCSLPVKLLLHALLLQAAGGLVMPSLFIACGPVLDVWLLTALYAWAVSWQAPRPEGAA